MAKRKKQSPAKREKKAVKKREKGLTSRQQRFVEEYLLDLNATQAAIRAGYAPANADKQGWQQLEKPRVSAAIQKAKAARTERTNVTADKVVRELARVGFSDVQSVARVTDEGIAVRLSEDWTEDDSRCVQSIGESFDKSGRRQVTVKLHDKMRALEALAKHTKVYDDSPNVNVNIPWAEMMAEVQDAKATRLKKKDDDSE